MTPPPADGERLQRLASLPAEFPPPPTDPDGPPVKLRDAFTLFEPTEGPPLVLHAKHVDSEKQEAVLCR